MKRLLVVVAAMLCMAGAPDPADVLADPAQEARARAIFQETRCVVCQNESIDDSNAELAQNLRQVIRGQVATGRTDAEVRTFLTSKYGDFILMKPRLTPTTYLLWGAPFAILLVGVGVLVFRRRKAAEPAPALTAAEIAELEAAVDRTDGA